MDISEIQIGLKVKSNVEFAGVPLGTEGYIIEDYGTGITIAWDMKDKPYPKNIPAEVIALMWAINPECPLRDGFDKENELQFLDIA